MRKTLNLILLLSVLFISSGCVLNKATATFDPTADLRSIKLIYVVKHMSDDRGTNILIANKLKKMGYVVTSGVDVPTNIDAVVTYEDKWWWDITMYMLELSVEVYDSKTNFHLASGNSFHGSLTRKTPEEMVDEVISNIFSNNK